MGLAVPAEYGGQGLPYAVHSAVGEYLSSANMAFMMYAGLTQGAIAAILAHGSDEQKSTWLPKMVEGVWTGTMNLTEPHCRHRSRHAAHQGRAGKATAATGFPARRSSSRPASTILRKTSSIWCSPASRARRKGVKGISLFIVPKFLLDADGNPGARNGVSCGSIEEKMGIHGNCHLRHEL